MLRLTLMIFSVLGLFFIEQPTIYVSGAMRNIMMKGDLSAKIDLDTLNKKHLYGLGPVANLKGEIMIIDGQVFTSEITDNQMVSKNNKVNKGAMLVYCYVENWVSKTSENNIANYVDLEKFVEESAKKEGINLEKPFVFKIEVEPYQIDYHIIDWKNGENHTMENHKQFAYKGLLKKSKVQLLGFYSNKHHSIFTHYTTNMHLHVFDEKTSTVGHLDNIISNNSIKIYFPKS